MIPALKAFVLYLLTKAAEPITIGVTGSALAAEIRTLLFG
jgi:hypothetical protein